MTKLSHLSEAEADMEAWVDIVEGTHGDGARAKRLVADHLVISIFGAYQATIREAIIQRAVQTGDADLGQFMKNILRGMSMTKNDLKRNILAVLGGRSASGLDMRISSEALCAYECMRRQRNIAAHGGHADIDPQKIRDLHGAAKAVVCETERVILAKKRHPHERWRPKKTDA